MLEVRGISASYGAVRALENVSLAVPAGRIVCLLGANGAGKTSTLNCISGVVPVTSGAIRFEGDDVTGWPIDRIVARGIVQVPEGREIFPELTVADNLLLGLWLRRREAAARQGFERVYDYFPRLKERADQHAGTLSGGEQQMLMVGRALMAQPKLLLLDEPSLGLSPILVQQLFAIIARVHADGVPILLVEQNAAVALAASDHAYILENGEIRLDGPARELERNAEVKAAYLGA
ncbi:MAG TPA: ABC transporter ATP-binding protein [Alphaproteobacteria bacterium]|jgi:branched-chain amino acid transport system ATP-binding protein